MGRSHKICWILAIGWLTIAESAPGSDLTILSTDRSGTVVWSNAFLSGVCTIEDAPAVTGLWLPQRNFFTSNNVGSGQVALPAATRFRRLAQVDLSTNNPSAFNDLATSYGILRTIAGNGLGRTDGSNYWRAAYENIPATSVSLSRPHLAMTDAAGNLFIVDKDSHSVLKVTSDGKLHTVAGTHVAGFNGDGPAAATNLQLNLPNGLWVRGDGTFYILDTGNGRVRRVDTNGVMTTLFTVGSGISTGRGLWVSSDESLIYFCSGTALRKRVPGNVSTLNGSFLELGNIMVEPNGDILATDRLDNRVYRVTPAGTRTVLFGNGTTNAVIDGTLALTNGLYGVRAIWPFPTGGYLLGTHEGSQLHYVDPKGIIRVLISGKTGNAHSGDGQWFLIPGLPKIAEVRSVTMDYAGNILLVENDGGYVRLISFLRLSP